MEFTDLFLDEESLFKMNELKPDCFFKPCITVLVNA